MNIPNENNDFPTSSEDEVNKVSELIREELLKCRSGTDIPVNFLPLDGDGRSVAEIMFPDIELFEGMTFLDAMSFTKNNAEEAPDNEDSLMGTECLYVEHEGAKAYYDSDGKFSGFTALGANELYVWHSSLGDTCVKNKFAWKVLCSSINVMSKRIGDVFSIEAEQSDNDEGVVFTVYAYTLPVWRSVVDGFLSYTDDQIACADVIDAIDQSLDGLYIPSTILDRMGYHPTESNRYSEKECEMFSLYCIGAESLCSKFSGQEISEWSVSVADFEINATIDNLDEIMIKLPMDQSIDEESVESVIEIAFANLINSDLGDLGDDPYDYT